MKNRKQSSTGYPITFLMVSSTDHVIGVTGLSPTVTISKNGGPFGSPSGAITEIGNGWYQLAGNSTDRNTLGDFLIHATGTGADPVDDRYGIVSFDPFDATRLGLSALPNATAGASGGVPLSVDSAGGVNAVQLAGTAQTAGDLYGYLATNLGALGANLSAVPKTGFKLAADGMGLVTAWTVAITGNITGNLSGSVGSISSFGTLVADIWTYTTRVLTAGTNISLAKGTGVTGFNDLDASAIRSAVGLALANLDTQLAALSSGQLTQANIRTAIGLAAANLDTQLAAIASNESTINSNVSLVGSAVAALGSPMQSSSPVTLATSQPNYAPAKAGDAMTLTSAYDASKTAMQTGAHVQLSTTQDQYAPAKAIDIPSAATNATAVRTELATELGRIDATITSRLAASWAGGVTLLKNWLGALAGKTSDAGTLAEINATAAGSGYDNTTDSLQALRDNADVGSTTVSFVVPQSVAQATLETDTIEVLRGDTLRYTFQNMGTLSGRKKVWFTAKRSSNFSDADSIIQITEGGGLEILNGGSPESSSWGSITVSESLQEISIELTPLATKLLSPMRGAEWDLQVMVDDSPVDTQTKRSGAMNVAADITRSTE